MTEPDTRTRLLLAAGPVFAARGYDGATVREICRAAEVNIASVAYYFGDKFGLYREVIERIREEREKRFPEPDVAIEDPREVLLGMVHTILSRMCAPEVDWETQIFIREMQNPTPVFEHIINEFFRPTFDRLAGALDRLLGRPVPEHVLQQLAFSVVGQCYFYRAGRGLVHVLVPGASNEEDFSIESLSQHITAVILSAVENGTLIDQRANISNWQTSPLPQSSTPGQ